MFENLLKTHKLMAGLLFAALLASGQEFRATLQGTIFDPNKAAVPGAELTLINNETGVERKTASDGEGHYLFQFIAPGKYSVTSKAAGFQTSTHEGVQLNVGDTVRLDIDLTLGAASETISVSASAVAVSTDASSLASLVGRDVIETLPLKGHSSNFIYEYAVGITAVGSGNKFGDDVRPIDQANGMRYTSNGSPLSTGDVSVDGVSNIVDVNRGSFVATYVPAVDSVLEWKMQSGTLPAEYGRSSGSIMNVVIKSGTNDPHGSLYDSWRNSVMDANYFFNNIGGTPLPAYNVNNFGLSIGAPVFLPKIYNGKNRTFLFVSYEGLRQVQAQTLRINVPTAKMRTGDFSEFPTQLYDPFSVQVVNGVQTRTPLPGNIVPPELQDPVGKAVFQYWPLPNLTPPKANTPWVSNYAMAARYPSAYDDTTVKFDETISSKQQAFVRVNYGPGHLWNPYDFPGIAGPGHTMNSRPNSGAAISDTYVFSPRVAADFRAGFQRGNNTTQPYSAGFNVASLGFAPSFVNSVTQGKAFPTFSFNDGPESLGSGGFANNPGQSVSTEDAVSINTGRHLFKAGVDIRQLRGSQFNNAAPDGSFSFSSSQTGGPNAAAPTGGFSLASLMMGFGSSGYVTTTTAISWQNVYYGGYFQDDFRVNSKLDAESRAALGARKSPN
jgi:hypothetical protein